MKVRLHDGKRLSAITLGGSELSDAGMLKIKGSKNLPYAQFQKKTYLRLAIGALLLATPEVLTRRLS